jgi:hypothetical protein
MPFLFSYDHKCLKHNLKAPYINTSRDIQMYSYIPVIALNYGNMAGRYGHDVGINMFQLKF